MWWIGLIMSGGLGGALLATIWVGAVADRFGRRRVLAALALLAALFGWAVPSALRNPVSMLFVSFLGMFNTSGSEHGAARSLEQALVADIAEARHRTMTFAVFHIVAALGAAIGAWLTIIAPERHFPLYALFFLGAMGSAVALSRKVEMDKPVSRDAYVLAPASMSIIRRMSLLFSVDALAGGFVIHGLVAVWFAARWGVSFDVLGPLFLAAHLANAVSYYVAAKMAGRLGLLNTAVTTHLASNGLLLLVPFMPSFGSAVGVYLLRQMLSQMDVPTRESYFMGILPPEDRVAGAAMTTTARLAAQALGPNLAGAVLSWHMAAPFVVAGLVKSAYDAALYRSFRLLKPPEESGTHR